MGTLKEKLDYLDGTKTAIKEALVSKGVEVTEADTFRSYADKITNIPAGGGGDPFSELGYNTPKPILDGIDYGKQILVNYNPDESWSMYLRGKWENDKQLMFFPNVGVYNGVDMYGCFQKSNLIYCPKLDSHNVTDMSYMFNGCSSLKEIGGFTDTSSVTDMSYMFSSCISLTSVPAMDTSSVTDMSDMFDGCSSLKEIGGFTDTSKVTDMSDMFDGCISLTSVPAMDTSSVTDMSYMFEDCSSLKEIGGFTDTSKVTDMSDMFNGCSSLTSVPAMNTSSVTDMSYMFLRCSILLKVEGILDLTSVTNVNYMFDAYGNISLKYMKLTNLGTPQSITRYDFSYCNKWGDETPSTEHPEIDVTGSKQAMIDSLLTDSFDRATAGYSVCTIKLKSDVKARLTQEQIDAIQTKGYTLTFA